MENVKIRIPEIDLLRGLAATLMILGHSFIVYPIDISNVVWCKAIAHFIYTFHMELFFLLAGAVYHCSNYVGFITKKVQRILIPYLFFASISLLLHAFGGSAVNGTESLEEGIYKMFFHGGNYWFLYVLFIIFIVFPWIEKTVTKKFLLYIGIIILILSDIIKIPNWFALDTVAYFLPYFILGRYVPEFLRGNYYNTKKKRICSVVLTVILYILLDGFEIFGHQELGVILSFIRAIAIIILLYVIILELCPYWNRNKGMAFLNKFLSDSSTFSLQLYLFNGYLLTIIRIVICQIMHISNPILIVLAVWGGNMAVTLIACKWIIPRIPIVRELCGLVNAKV